MLPLHCYGPGERHCSALALGWYSVLVAPLPSHGPGERHCSAWALGRYSAVVLPLHLGWCSGLALGLLWPEELHCSALGHQCLWPPGLHCLALGLASGLAAGRHLGSLPERAALALPPKNLLQQGLDQYLWWPVASASPESLGSFSPAYPE